MEKQRADSCGTIQIARTLFWELGSTRHILLVRAPAGEMKYHMEYGSAINIPCCSQGKAWVLWPALFRRPHNRRLVGCASANLKHAPFVFCAGLRLFPAVALIYAYPLPPPPNERRCQHTHNACTSYKYKNKPISPLCLYPCTCVCARKKTRIRHDGGRTAGGAEAVELRGVRAEEVDEKVRPVRRRLLHQVLPEGARQRPPHQAHVDTRRADGVRRVRGGGTRDGTEQGGGDTGVRGGQGEIGGSLPTEEIALQVVSAFVDVV